MKKEKLAAALIIGAGAAVAAYSLLSKDIPTGAMPVQQFDMNKYLGLWHEIARLPNRIERTFNQLTEEYLDNGDGTYKVITKGFDFKKGKWTEATGKIKFLDTEDIGMLRVSYFGPFYANYNILALDENYQYAMVSGSGLSYLWLLSRETTMPDDVKIRFLKIANEIGFEIGELEWL